MEPALPTKLEARLQHQPTNGTTYDVHEQAGAIALDVEARQPGLTALRCQLQGHAHPVQRLARLEGAEVVGGNEQTNRPP